MKQKHVVLGVRDIPTPFNWLTFSLQHLFAMFGATILVPKLVELSPAVALVSSGLGTLAYIIITKGQIPAYLGSSFAFIAPILGAKAAGGPGAAMIGAFMAGIVYGLIALLIQKLGTGWVMNLLPPIVVGPVIIVIGLGLAPTAVDMAMYDTSSGDPVYSLKYFAVAGFTLLLTVVCAIFLKGFFSLIPVLIGIIGGYLFALTQGIVNFQQVIDANWISVPEFVFPFVDYTPSLTTLLIGAAMVPVAFVTMSEHIGHQMVLSKVVGTNFIEKPGLHRSIFGDSVATMMAACIGGPPTTTYGENIGVLAITRVFSVFIIGGAAVLAFCFGFVGKISALISSIPTPVMGGVSFLLFGIIASSGLRMLIDNRINLEVKRNLIISSVILVIGVGGAFIQISKFQLTGMALSAIIGVILNLALPGKDTVTENESQDIV